MSSIKDKKIEFKSSVFTGNKLTCTGCGACSQVCTKQAIKMEEDSEGFLFPKIDPVLCVKCGKCDRVCPVINSHQENFGYSQQCYIVTNVDNNYSRNCATVGVATMLAESIINQGGYVYGVFLDETEWRAKHICINKESAIGMIKNSKYVQSNTRNTFSEVKKRLLNDELVLFTGTPCQIAGLKSFLRKDYDNLFTLDLICHGTYSYKLLQQEVEYWKLKYKGVIKNFRFRSKEQSPWNIGGIINFDVYKNGSKYMHVERHGSCSPIYRCYAYSGDGKNYTLRESCYSCSFRSDSRYGDITVGDAWGLAYSHPEVFTKENCKSGISLVLINSTKGNRLFAKIHKNLFVKEVSHSEAFNQEALNPTFRIIPKERAEIYAKYDKVEWGALIENILHVNFDVLYKQYKMKQLKMKIKDLIKTVIFYKLWRK